MRLTIVTIFLSIGFISKAQHTTFYAGLGERFEKTTYQGGEYKGNQITHYKMGFDHTNDEIIVGLGFNFYHDNLTLDSKKHVAHFARYQNTSTTTFSYSELSYSYLGVNFSVGPSLFNRQRFRLGFVANFQIDVLISENESNHSQYGSRVNTSFNPITYETNSTITSYPKVTDEFDAASLPSDFASFGVNISPEFYLKKHFISPYYSFGINSRWRIFDNWAETIINGRKESSVQTSVQTFHEIGVKLGIRHKKANPESQ